MPSLNECNRIQSTCNTSSFAWSSGMYIELPLFLYCSVVDLQIRYTNDKQINKNLWKLQFLGIWLLGKGLQIYMYLGSRNLLTIYMYWQKLLRSCWEILERFCLLLCSTLLVIFFTHCILSVGEVFWAHACLSVLSAVMQHNWELWAFVRNWRYCKKSEVKIYSIFMCCNFSLEYYGNY